MMGGDFHPTVWQALTAIEPDDLDRAAVMLDRAARRGETHLHVNSGMNEHARAALTERAARSARAGDALRRLARVWRKYPPLRPAETP